MKMSSLIDLKTLRTPMKRLLISAFCFLLSLSVVSAQTPANYDIATFQSPDAWQKQTTDNSVQFSIQEKAAGTFCLITVFKSIPAVAADPKTNFNASWETIVRQAVNVSEPQMMPAENREEWKAVGGFSSFEKDGEQGAAVLLNISGYGKMVNVLVLTNTQKYEPNITAFLESISLKAPVAAPPQAAAVAGADAVSVIG